MKRAMRSDSHKGESKISVANNYLGEFHLAIKKQIIDMKRFNLFVQVFSRNALSLFYFIPISVLLVSFMAASCGTTKPSAAANQKVKLISDKDSTEYTLIVLDVGYESYLATKPSAHFYSQQYYENWNRQYVMEWNNRHRNPLRYGGFYETEINYDPMEDYGLELNYRLYYYFQFIKDRYGIVLVARGR